MLWGQVDDRLRVQVAARAVRAWDWGIEAYAPPSRNGSRTRRQPWWSRNPPSGAAAFYVKLVIGPAVHTIRSRSDHLPTKETRCAGIS